jgi:hypothetical protein
MANLLDSTGALVGILSVMGGLKLAGIIGQLALLNRRLALTAFRGGIAKAMVTGIGALIIGGLAVAAGAAVYKAVNKNPGFQGLSPGTSATITQGEGTFHAGETVYRLDDISGMNDSLKMIAANTNPANNTQQITIGVDDFSWAKFSNFKSNTKIG